MPISTPPGSKPGYYPPVVPPVTSMPNGAVAALTNGKAGTTVPAAAPPVDVQALRTMLVKAGYHIPATGDAAGSLFKAALRDYLQPSASHPVSQRILALVGADKPGSTLISGLRNPSGFNQRYGLTKGGKIVPPTKTPGGRLTPSGTPTAADTLAQDDVPNGYPPSGDGAAPLFDASGLDRIAAMLQKQGIGTDVPLIPTSYADQLAGLAHDAKIHDLGIAGQRQTRDAAQSLEDIGHWYGQVGDARANAATRDHAITNAGVGSVKDAVASIVSSLGGSANQGAGLVGASGADQVGLLGALGANEDQYNADLRPLLSAESAGARTRQQATNTKNAQDIQSQLIDEQGARGQDKANAILQIMNENASRRGQNNALDQNRFQDALAIEQAKEAATLSGARVVSALSRASQPPKPGKGSFGASSTSDRTSFAKDVLSQLAPGGKLAAGMTRSKAISLAQRVARIYWPQGGIPNGTGLIASIVQQAGL